MWINPHASGTRSILRIRTWDRPGVLTKIVKMLKDISVNVVSAEIDTIGDEVDDTFYVTYHGQALPGQVEQLVINMMSYELGLPNVNADSY